MRIGVNATSIMTDATGLAVASMEIAKEILRQVQDVRVYTTSQELKCIAPRRVSLATPMISPACRTRGKISRLMWCQTALPARLLSDRIDIAYSTVEEGMLWGGFRQVVTCHDIIPVLYPHMDPRKRVYMRSFVPLILRSSAAVICISENTKRDLVSAFHLEEEKLFVVPNGMNHNRFFPRENTTTRKKYGLDKFLLYVGDMRPYKNVQRAIEAFGRLDMPEHKFLIVGTKDERYYPEVFRLVSKLGLQEKVLFPGYVSQEDLPNLYGSADAFVFPSLYEGFGMTPLEAMACGCPVVTSRAASLPEVCGEAAYYVDPYDVDSIAEGIHSTVNKPELRQHLMQKGLERAKGFEWSKTVRRVLEILELVARGRLDRGPVVG